MRSWSASLALAAAFLLGGCLSSAHFVPRDELTRIAQLPPEQRGQELRVLQGVFGAAPGRGYERAPVLVDPASAVIAGARTHARHQRMFRGARRAIESRGSNDDSRSDGRDADARGSSSRSSSRGGGGPDLGEGGGMVVAVIIAVAVVTAGITVTAVLAATEGSRYDGYVRVSPEHPLYLDMSDGRRLLVPLAMLTPQDAYYATQAMIEPRDGPYWTELGRRPLDRVGPAFALDFGASGTASAGTWWPQIRVGFGGFFLQQLGVFASFSSVFGSQDGLLLNLRYGAEVQGYPLELSPFSLGIYASAFDNHRAHEDATLGLQEEHAFGWSAGIVMQLEVSTRMAVTLRGGPTIIHERGNDVITGEVTVGAAIY